MRCPHHPGKYHTTSLSIGAFSDPVSFSTSVRFVQFSTPFMLLLLLRAKTMLFVL